MKTLRSRGGWVAGLAVAAGVLIGGATLPSDAWAQEKVSLRFSWKVGAEHVPFIVAKEKGFYAAEGLDVTLNEGMGLGSGGVLKLVGAKEETFGISQTATTLKAVVRGLPVVQVMTINSVGLNGILLKADSGIKAPKDLIGKTIAGSGGGMIDIMQAFLDVNNVPVNQVKYVATGTGRLESMVAGRADGALGNGFNDLLDVRLMGAKDATILLFKDWGVPESGAGVVAHADTVKQNPELVRRFVRASLKGIAATVANFDEAVAISKKHFPMVDPVVLLPRLKLLKDQSMLPDPLGWQDPKVIEALKELSAKYDKLPQAKEISTDRIATNDFLPKK
ncbi:MAG: ABC transporter substrate-binding protein [Burkholderiales bacterium]|nr:ABC transporter substrate-binding protein [Burkholderiales bacterium]